MFGEKYLACHPASKQSFSGQANRRTFTANKPCQQKPFGASFQETMHHEKKPPQLITKQEQTHLNSPEWEASLTLHAETTKASP